MSSPTIASYLAYANLQMAAEGFLVTGAGVPLTGTDYTDALEAGNNHSLLFTETQATEFAAQWDVVDQKQKGSASNDTTVRKGRDRP